MYGYFNNIIRTFVVERFGHSQWEAIAKKCKSGNKQFDEQALYDDKTTVQLLDAAANVLHESVDDLLESLGEFYLHQLRVRGHDLLFKTLGETLTQFLDNLDYVHHLAAESFPQMRAPSFRCDASSTPSSIVLHYYSVRRGSYRMVAGLVRAIAGIYSQSYVDISVRSIELERFSEKHVREHVVFSIACQNESESALVPPTFVAQTRRQSERQILKEDVEKVQKKLEMVRREYGESLLPLNKDKVQQDRWTAIIDARNLYKDFNASYPSRFHMNVFIFCHVFPYHVVFDERMVIVQSGVQLQKILPALKSESASIKQCFTLMHPVQMDLTFDNVRKLVRSPFILETRRQALHDQYGDKPLLRLRGQMIYMEMLGSILFLCSPLVDSLKQLEERTMHLADIPPHDVTRRMVLHSFNKKTEEPVPPKVPDRRESRPIRAGAPLILGDRHDFLRGVNYSDHESLRNELFAAVAELEKQRDLKDELLQRMTPSPWAEKVRNGDSPIAGEFKAASVLFCDVVMFAQVAARCSARDTVSMLNTLQAKFDALTHVHGVHRVQSIGDAYCVVSGVPEPCEKHLERLANTGLAMLVGARGVRSPYNYGSRQGRYCKVRLGLHTGPVKAGVVGVAVPELYVMGDTVMMASRLESHGIPEQLHVSAEVYKQLRSKDYTLERRGEIDVRGVGKLTTYLLVKHDSLSADQLMGRAEGASEGAPPAPVSRQLPLIVTDDGRRSNRVHPSKGGQFRFLAGNVFHSPKLLLCNNLLLV